MKKEHSLILKAVLQNKSEKEIREIDKILDSNLDWIEIAGIALNHRLGGYIYKGLNTSQQNHSKSSRYRNVHCWKNVTFLKNPHQQLWRKVINKSQRNYIDNKILDQFWIYTYRIAHKTFNVPIQNISQIVRLNNKKAQWSKHKEKCPLYQYTAAHTWTCQLLLNFQGA